MKWAIKAGALITAGLIALGAAAQSQSRVEAKKDWSVFEAESDGNKICWIVSRPSKSIALRGGKQVQVRRGDIYLMVAVRPADGVENQVSFISGYPFKKGSEVEVDVSGDDYTMFTDNQDGDGYAWMASDKEDDAIVAAFKKGLDAKMEGVSHRGTTTVDTFSLLGFTAAIESAQKRCG